MPRRQIPQLKNCARCRVIFQPKREWQKFCCATCRAKFHRQRESAHRRIDRLEKDMKRLVEFVGMGLVDGAITDRPTKEPAIKEVHKKQEL